MIANDVILVVGMPRSGTSALTRVLSLSGCTLPRSVLAARPLNPRGFWEPVDAVKLNHDFLLNHHREATEQFMGLLQTIPCPFDEREGFINRIQSFLSACPRDSTLLIKELDIAIFMDLWHEAARREGLSVKIVISVRHPAEVLASCFALGNQVGMDMGLVDRTELERMSVVYLCRNLLAEMNSRRLPRVFVDYSNLMNDWRSEVGRISKSLSIPLKGDADAIDAFLSPDLYRQRATTIPPSLFCSVWLKDLYSTLRSVANDDVVDAAKLESIAEAYRSSKHTSDLLLHGGHQPKAQAALENVSRWPVWQAGQDY